jgi:hypothetical protein
MVARGGEDAGGCRLSDAEPCVICTPRREEDELQPRPRNPGDLTCPSCPAAVRGHLVDIADAFDTLSSPPPTPQAPWDVTVANLITARGLLVLDEQRRPIPVPRPRAVPGWGNDPVSAALPAALTPGARGVRVTASREATVPVRLDHIDLAGTIRPVGVLSDAGSQWEDDQVGHLSVASELHAWAVDLAAHRNIGEHPPGDGDTPAATVQALTTWIRLRVDDACRDYPEVAGLASAVWWLRGTLRSACGLVDIPDHKPWVPCRRCNQRKLVRIPGSDWIECGNCPELLSPAEYDRWAGLQSASHRAAARRAGLSLADYGRTLEPATPVADVDAETISV